MPSRKRCRSRTCQRWSMASFLRTSRNKSERLATGLHMYPKASKSKLIARLSLRKTIRSSKLTKARVSLKESNQPLREPIWSITWSRRMCCEKHWELQQLVQRILVTLNVPWNLIWTFPVLMLSSTCLSKIPMRCWCSTLRRSSLTSKPSHRKFQRNLSPFRRQMEKFSLLEVLVDPSRVMS